MRTRDYEVFLKRLNAANSHWNCCRVALIALYDGNKWCAIQTEITFHEDQPSKEQIIHQSENIIGLILYGKVGKWIKQAQNGFAQPIEWSGGLLYFSYEALRNRPFLEDSSIYCTFNEVNHVQYAKTQYPILRATDRLRKFQELCKAMGLDRDDLVEELDCSDKQFENFKDLSSELFEWRENDISVFSSDDLKIQICAEVPWRLERLESKSSGNLVLRISEQMLQRAGDLTVGVIASEITGKRERFSFPVCSLISETAESILEIPLNRIPYEQVKLTIRLDRHVLHKITFKRPSLQALVSLAITDNLLELEKALFLTSDRSKLLNNLSKGKNSNKSKEFEPGVAWLLSLLGFNCIALGGLDRMGTIVPDLVAFPQYEPGCLLVECTLRDPDKRSKVAKLVERRAVIIEALGKTPVKTALITASPRSAVISDPKMYKKGEVTLVTGDELRETVEQIREGVSAFGTMDALKTLGIGRASNPWGIKFASDD